MTQQSLIFALEIIILFFSVILHEVMHGLVALKFGDTTAQRAGRLTLNPLPHIDLMGTIVLPILFILSGVPVIGMAKPVPVNPLNFTNIKTGEFMVSAAGIATNLALAVVSSILFHIFNSLATTPIFLLLILKYTAIINLYLGIFNLIPIPPLDGSKMLLSQLPYKLAREYEKLERQGFLILAALIFLPFFLHLPSPLLILLEFIVNIIRTFLGI